MEEQEITIDLRDLWNVLKKNTATIRKVTIGCVAAAVVYLIVVPPTYESTALLRVKQPKGLGSSILEALPTGNPMASKQLMSTYAEILKSRSVVVPVIEATSKDGDKKINTNAVYDGFVKGRIITAPLKDTEIMKVTFKANTAEDAQKGNKLLVEGFLNRLTELERGEQKTTRQFIEERINTSKEELQAAESVLTEFKKEHKLLAPESQVQLAAEKLTLADKLRAENQVALEAARARNNAVKAQLQNNTASIADNATISGMQAKLAELEAERVSYLDKYTDKHPRVIEVNKEIANMRKTMDAEFKRVAEMMVPSSNPVHQGLLADMFKSEAEISVAQSNLQAVKALENKYNNDVATLSEVEQEYLTLLRDVTVSQEIYVMLAKRLEEAKVAEVAVSTEVQVVDEPTLPDRRVAPSRSKTLVLAFLLGILGSSGFVIARELMNRTVKTSEDVENYLGLPVLGQIPSSESLKEAEEVANLSIWQKIWRAVWKQ